MGHEASFHLASWERAPKVRKQDQTLFISLLVPPVPSSEVLCHTARSPQWGGKAAPQLDKLGTVYCNL